MEIKSEMYESIIQNMKIGIYFVDWERRIFFWNDYAEVITGFTRSEVLNSRCMDNILNHVDSTGTELCKGTCPLHLTLSDGRERDAKIFLHHKKGYRVPVQIKISPIRNTENQIIGAVEIFWDISEEFKIEEEYSKFKMDFLLDHLTNLPNKNCLMKKTEDIFKEYHKLKFPFSILKFQIEDFNNIINTYGQKVSNDLISMISSTLIKNTRTCDFLGRWDENEFLIIVKFMNNQQLYDYSLKLHNLIETSFMLNGNEKLSITAVIGGASASDKDDSISLLSKCDEHLQLAKKQTKPKVYI